mmetsp:Transcript_42678/g.100125  ORF Transcript_42678/g.100125 Transcript_42678/m.100125 type:complete len:243 (-) Transcript_42678:92-820(-)
MSCLFVLLRIPKILTKIVDVVSILLHRHGDALILAIEISIHDPIRDRPAPVVEGGSLLPRHPPAGIVRPRHPHEDGVQVSRSPLRVRSARRDRGEVRAPAPVSLLKIVCTAFESVPGQELVGLRFRRGVQVWQGPLNFAREREEAAHSRCFQVSPIVGVGAEGVPFIFVAAIGVVVGRSVVHVLEIVGCVHHPVQRDPLSFFKGAMLMLFSADKFSRGGIVVARGIATQKFFYPFLFMLLMM